MTHAKTLEVNTVFLQRCVNTTHIHIHTLTFGVRRTVGVVVRIVCYVNIHSSYVGVYKLPVKYVESDKCDRQRKMASHTSPWTNGSGMTGQARGCS